MACWQVLALPKQKQWKQPSGLALERPKVPDLQAAHFMPSTLALQAQLPSGSQRQLPSSSHWSSRVPAGSQLHGRQSGKLHGRVVKKLQSLPFHASRMHFFASIFLSRVN